jgi:hypothetical protein
MSKTRADCNYVCRCGQVVNRRGWVSHKRACPQADNPVEAVQSVIAVNQINNLQPQEPVVMPNVA